jgi:hypothetical protein
LGHDAKRAASLLVAMRLLGAVRVKEGCRLPGALSGREAQPVDEVEVLPAHGLLGDDAVRQVLLVTAVLFLTVIVLIG